ncbi:hypothetical protein VK792_18130 [Mesobacterium sp. TK19101]|uniref:Uncharacterized protein n=1 Tax=Mesobacterium hydrothermale TaxID=3111907 RepID=A0ABU6HMZ8_9RHOB|nr:hypothetical protein [Mesobacterium sp. TK19101]MEC3863215.1 hypothetical protein [Mesobacterium sp. TK19101]
MKTRGDAHDPKALIAESYRIDGITESDCRTIFLDWALSMPDGSDTAASLRILLARHGAAGHPMTDVLTAGLAAAAVPRRRGGRAGRTSP